MREKYSEKQSSKTSPFWRGKWKFILCTCLLCISQLTKSQSNTIDSIEYYRFPLQVSFGNQCVGLPYQNVFSTFNPAFYLGTEVGYNKNRKHHICQTAGLGFYANEVIGNTITLNSDFCYRFTHKSGVFADISLGLGIINQFHPRDIYEYSPSTGAYDKVKDYGKLAILLENGLSLGYDLSYKTKIPISIFIKHNFFIQTPYFDLKSFPFMPQSITQIGLKIKIRKYEK